MAIEINKYEFVIRLVSEGVDQDDALIKGLSVLNDDVDSVVIIKSHQLCPVCGLSMEDEDHWNCEEDQTDDCSDET